MLTLAITIATEVTVTITITLPTTITTTITKTTIVCLSAFMAPLWWAQDQCKGYGVDTGAESWGCPPPR